MANAINLTINTTAKSYEEKTLEQALSSPFVLIPCLLLTLLLILIMFGNLTVMRTVHLTQKLHYSAFYFVFSLALADFMVGFLVPLSVVHIVAQHMKNRWIAGDFACDLWTFANVWFVVASLLNLCMVSWDRYVAVTSPFKYKQCMRGKRVRILIALVWIVSFLIGVLYTIAFNHAKDRKHCQASGLSLYSSITCFTMIYAIPTLFLLFVNLKVILVARRHRRHISAQEVSPTWITEDGDGIEIKNDKRKSMFFNEVKTFKTFIIVIGTFVACYTPFFILLLLHPLMGIEKHIPHIAVILFYVKSGLNPMIYGASSKDLRVAAANSLKRRRRALADSSDPDNNKTPTASVLEVPNENENRALSPLKIDDIIANANTSEK